jgi:hypothetical protein
LRVYQFRHRRWGGQYNLGEPFSQVLGPR